MLLTDNVKVEIERIFWAIGCAKQSNYNAVPILLENSASNLDGHPKKLFDINEIFDGFLWGVPTNRRSVEKRMMRKYGVANWHNKLLLPRKDLLTCNSCGDHHEKGRLCPNCYAKIKAETLTIQEEMIKEQGLKPVDKEVVILYEGEAETNKQEFLKGKQIIEMKKPRPQWFNDNLLQKSGPSSNVNDVSVVKALG